MSSTASPSLEALMARYLERQAESHDLGITGNEGPEVVPYDAGPVQPVDARLAWDEARVALEHFKAPSQDAKPPVGWASLVSQNEPHVAIAFCVGNFPQLVRNFHQLLQSSHLVAPKPTKTKPISIVGFDEWASKASTFSAVIWALAGWRLARQFDRAEALVQEWSGRVPDTWQAAWDNEIAALAWHRGNANEAISHWQRQTPALPVRFNLAMADLFTGRARQAGVAFEQVLAELPDHGGWHHLARLYHTLSQMRA